LNSIIFSRSGSSSSSASSSSANPSASDYYLSSLTSPTSPTNLASASSNLLSFTSPRSGRQNRFNRASISRHVSTPSLFMSPHSIPMSPNNNTNNTNATSGNKKNVISSLSHPLLGLGLNLNGSNHLNGGNKKESEEMEYESPCRMTLSSPSVANPDYASLTVRAPLALLFCSF
jgi:hypothetical protein